jgi:hypothetical protein
MCSAMVAINPYAESGAEKWHVHSAEVLDAIGFVAPHAVVPLVRDGAA